ncbi:MAG: transporter substrate-binding domain-containing protein [Clostridiales bacterium]|nr:transporter substrate-binding domain-containing protein [Clostridiales bacterium]
MKKLVIALSIVVIVCSLAACSLFSDYAPKETKRTSITVGFDASSPPMSFENDGEYVGFDLECAQAVADELGLELKLQPVLWKEKDEALNSGKIDMIWSGFSMHTGTRDEDYTWSEPYMENYQVVIVMSASYDDCTADLAGKKVALQEGSSAIDALKKKEGFYETVKRSLVYFDDNTEALKELEMRNIDAVIVDSTMAEYLTRKYPGLYRVLDELVAEEEYGIGFKKGDTELRDLVQGAMDRLAENGKLTEISTKWFGRDLILTGKDK